MKYLFLLFTVAYTTVFAQKTERVILWENEVPSENRPKADPVISDNHARNVWRISEVTNPAITVYLADEEKANGAGLLVMPGGGYHHLAMDIEGHEVAEWLSTLGFNAYVLEYRVPGNRLGALMDAQRAMRLIRSNSEKWNQDVHKLGAIGFSAGGSLAANISMRNEEVFYQQDNGIDRLSAKPDFAALIYGGGLADGPNGSVTPEFKFDANTPPMFLFATADDGLSDNSFTMAAALRANNTPVEFHLVQTGGHGYGKRAGNQAAETWPSLFESWVNKLQKIRLLTEAEKADGWEMLFNGEDFTGWRGVNQTGMSGKRWAVRDGSIVVNSSDGSETGNDIVTKEEYGAFEMKFEFKLTEGANSGIKYFVNEAFDSNGKSGIGLEYQILDDERHPDAKMGVVGNRTLASLYDLIPSAGIPKKEIGEWNSGRLVVFPDHRVQHWLNGMLALEYQRKGDIYKVLVARSKYEKFENFGLGTKGPILLQDHGDEVHYRNIKIRRL